MHRLPCGSDTPKTIARASSRAFETTAEKLTVPQPTGKTVIAFKGFVEEVDSFGGFQYQENYFAERCGHCRWNPDSPGIGKNLSCSGPWTGAFDLKCSSLSEDVNAAPDVTAIMRDDRRALDAVIPKQGRLLVVGLAMDFCVLDSCVNASMMGYKDIFVAADATRPAYIPGPGFLTPPDFLVNKFKEAGVKFVMSKSVF